MRKLERDLKRDSTPFVRLGYCIVGDWSEILSVFGLAPSRDTFIQKSAKLFDLLSRIRWFDTSGAGSSRRTRLGACKIWKSHPQWGLSDSDGLSWQSSKFHASPSRGRTKQKEVFYTLVTQTELSPKCFPPN